MASTWLLNWPGESGFSTSAITATRIWFLVTPVSPAAGCSLWAPAGATATSNVATSNAASTTAFAA